VAIKRINLVSAIRETSKAVKADAGMDYHPVGWESILPFAAKELLLSADPKDYLIYPVPIMYSDLPNRNGFAFPLSELLKWNVELGRQAYKGWSGMPMYKEHKSDDHKKALGMVIDTSLRKIEGYGKGLFYKVMALAAIDRNKDSELAERMERGALDTYSMGAMVDYCSCSYCGKVAGECDHVDESNDTVSFREINGELVFKNVHGVRPYELSVVSDPAYGVASHTHRIDYELGTVDAFTGKSGLV
jgi:hypothetical protein